MHVEAVIFDLDGTLVETEAQWDKVRRGLAADFGLPWPDGATPAMMGLSTQEWSRYLVEEVGYPCTPEEAAEMVIDKMAEHHEQGAEVLPGAVECVRLMADSYRVAIASSSPRRLIDAAVTALGIADALSATVSTEEVERGKPSPDGYLRAAELLGVEPTACVAVEDSTNGIQSALAAGMRVVVVPPKFHPPREELLRECMVLDSLHQLTPGVLESW